MNMKSFLSILILIFSTAITISQQDDDYIIVVGDSMVGRSISGEMIREVFGKVKLTQGNVVITCSKAVQYISRNDAVLTGNVIIVQDTLTITTDEAFYYGNEKRSESKTPLKLDDKKVILTADRGEYYFNEDRAYFRDNVRLYDTVTTLTSNELTYYKNENRSVAVGAVKIIDPDNIIEAEKLQHYRDHRVTFADIDVKITSKSNNVIIYGDHLEDYAERSYTIINKNPLLIQIDSSYVEVNDTIPGNGVNAFSVLPTRKLEIDTLLIRSLIMEAYRDTLNIFKAKDSVKIVRSNFASRNDFSVYYRDEDKIVTEKLQPEAPQPVLWYENSQLTGDSITIFLRENQIQLIDILNNAFILSRDKIFSDRYDQISGSRIIMHFDDDGIKKMEVFEGVLSIYYLYEEGTPNGLTKSSAQSAVIEIFNGKVNQVKLYGSPSSEYYPENMVQGNELSYTLPQYFLHENRPVKSDLLKSDLLLKKRGSYD